MKTTEAAEIISGSTRMKSQHTSPRNGSAGRRVPMRIPEIPLEWMDPMSWRLPSGKALAEFALQAGFLAPLILGGPHVKHARKRGAPAAPKVQPPGLNNGLNNVMNSQVGEEPEPSGTFRESR